MRQVYLGGTLINDVFLGNDRMDDVLQDQSPLNIDWLLVGGGGSGGTAGPPGCGAGSGGAGRFVSSSITIPFGTDINTVIGLGGAGVAYTPFFGNPGRAGQTSTATILDITYTAPGGGFGGGGSPSAVTGSGGRGGSGGGRSNCAGGAGEGDQIGVPIAGFGNNGASTGDTPRFGGGAGGTPTGRAWVDGITYAGGGGSGLTTAGSGNVGVATNFVTNSPAAQNGIFKLRYLGTPKATGGTITHSGGYTYHEFTSSGTFTY
jgi:hypothetical protein